MEKKLNYPLLVALGVIAILVIIIIVPKKKEVITDYKNCNIVLTGKELSKLDPGDLLMRQICLEQKITELKKQKNEVQGLRDEKTASLRGEIIEEVIEQPVEDNPQTQLNNELDLQ